MSDITRILMQIDGGDPSAAPQLLPLVYDELRKLAAVRLGHEQPGQTLQATALVHEAYLQLVKNADTQDWHSRGHFFAAAAESMRRILIGRARSKHRLKRGGGWNRRALHEVACVEQADAEDLLALDDALQQLAVEHPCCAELVKLRFFAGLTLHQAAESLGISDRTADRQWAFARAWLYQALQAGDDSRSEDG